MRRALAWALFGLALLSSSPALCRSPAGAPAKRADSQERAKSPKKGKETTPKGHHAPLSSLPGPQMQNACFTDWLMELRVNTDGASAGRANSGAVHGAAEMPLVGPTWRFMSVVEGRKTNFGTVPLITLLIRASAAVAEEFPGSVLLVGNMGLASGGKIVQSKSHQSGRDVDVAFYALDKKGRPIDVGTFVHFNSQGKAAGGIRLDVARTWAFVKAMVSSNSPAVQWMFASKGVVTLLLEHAKAIKEPDWVVDRAQQVLHQPSDSNPHDDHFHIRVHCSETDLMWGCEEYGTPRPWLVRDMAVVEEEAQRLLGIARLGSRADRLAATVRLSKVMCPRAEAALETLLCSSDAAVVEAAAQGLSRRNPAKGDFALLAHLKCAKSAASALVLLRPSQYRLGEGVAREAEQAFKTWCAGGEYGEAEAEFCAVAAGILGRSRDFGMARHLLEYLRATPPVGRGPVRSALQTLYICEAPAELLADGDAGTGKGKVEGHRKGGKTKKGGTKGGKKGSVQAAPQDDEVEAWTRAAKKVGSPAWVAYAEQRLRSMKVLRAGSVGVPANLRRLFGMLKQKPYESFAAQVLMSTTLAVELPYLMLDENAVGFWRAKVPKAETGSAADKPKKKKGKAKAKETAPPPPRKEPPPPDFEP